MAKKYNIAVIGATGNVGREVLSMLAARNFPVKDVFVSASSKSIGVGVGFGDLLFKDLFIRLLRF